MIATCVTTGALGGRSARERRQQLTLQAAGGAGRLSAPVDRGLGPCAVDASDAAVTGARPVGSRRSSPTTRNSMTFGYSGRRAAASPPAACSRGGRMCRRCGWRCRRTGRASTPSRAPWATSARRACGSACTSTRPARPRQQGPSPPSWPSWRAPERRGMCCLCEVLASGQITCLLLGGSRSGAGALRRPPARRPERRGRCCLAGCLPAATYPSAADTSRGGAGALRRPPA